MVAAALLSLAIAVSVPAEEVPRSLDLVCERVLARHAQLQRLLLDFFMTATTQEGTRTDRLVQAHAPRRYYLDFKHYITPDTPASWKDPARFQLWLTPERARMFMPFGRTLPPVEFVEVKRYWRTHYGRAIGWHPDAQLVELPEEEPFYLDHVFAGEQRTRLRSRQHTETLESVECLVLETSSGSDRFWFAPSLDFALVKRVAVRGEEGRFRSEFRCRDFRRTAEGLWLPWQVEAVHSERIGGVTKPLRSNRIDVQELAVNDSVPDAVFAFTPPPGTLTYDVDGEVTAFEPGGRDILDLWAALCSEYYPPLLQQGLRSWEILFLCVPSFLGATVAAATLARVVRIRG